MEVSKHDGMQLGKVSRQSKGGKYRQREITITAHVWWEQAIAGRDLCYGILWGNIHTNIDKAGYRIKGDDVKHWEGK